MKKAIFVALFSILYQTASAQVLIALLFGDKLNTDQLEFGLMVSPTFSNLTNLDSKTKPGLGVGLYFRVKLSENLFFRPEVSPQAVFGAKGIRPYQTGEASIDSIYAQVGSNVRRSFKALSMPLMMQYRIKGQLFAELGPQVDCIIQAKDDFHTKIGGNPVDYTEKVGDVTALFDFGFSAGLEYKLKKEKGVGLGIRYYLGLTDVQQNMPKRQANTAWYLNISIPIGIGSPKP